MRIGTVNGEHSTLILSFGVFALKPGCHCVITSQAIKLTILSSRNCGTIIPNLMFENLNHSIMYKFSPHYGLGRILPVIKNSMFFILHLKSYSSDMINRI